MNGCRFESLPKIKANRTRKKPHFQAVCLHCNNMFEVDYYLLRIQLNKFSFFSHSATVLPSPQDSPQMSSRSNQIKEPILQDQSETHSTNSLPEADKPISCGEKRKRPNEMLNVKRRPLGMRGLMKLNPANPIKSGSPNASTEESSKDDEEKENMYDSWYTFN